MEHLEGKVLWFNHSYGFIAGQDNVDYFVHHSAIIKENSLEFSTLSEGENVEFDTDENEKGPFAKNVKSLDD